MDKFYFTFGSGGSQPYTGGWVEIHADSKGEAIEKFNRAYPPRNMSTYVNCAFIYRQKEFEETIMFKENDNLGYACHEIIE